MRRVGRQALTMGAQVREGFAEGAVGGAKAQTMFAKLNTKSLFGGAAAGAGFIAASFAAEELVKFLKEGVGGALQLQKSSEAINAEFGDSADKVKEFAHG